MAYEADRVVVEVIAKTDGMDGPVKASANTFDQSMSKIEAAAGKAEKAHGRLTLAANNNRIAMLEFQHIARGASDQIAAGAPLTQVLAQHMGMLSQAVSFAGGTFGKLGSFLGGPWGIAITFATVILAKLTLGHKDSADSVESLLTKLKEHAEKTHNSEEADRLWANTLDGLIERQQKLNEELGKRLTVQAAVDIQDLAKARTDLAAKETDLAAEKKHLASLKSQLAAAQTQPVSGGSVPGAAAAANDIRIGGIQKQIAASKDLIGKLQTALQKIQTGITEGQTTIGEAQGKALADATASASRFTDLETAALRALFAELKLGQGDITKMSAAFDTFSTAMSAAANVGVPFADDAAKVNELGRSLLQHKITIKDWTTEVLKLAKALQEQADAAKEAAKQNPKETFKRSVIGAEGTGPNQMGSSAAGFGQFISSTWLSYFNRLFPDKAALSDAAKLGFRNIRSVAEAVIDKATNDYAAVLKDAGQKLTAANLYAVHVLGSKDAKKFFAAAPGTQTSSFLSNQVLAGNPFLNGTVAQASAAIAKRIGDSSAAVSQGAAALVQQLAQEKERERQFANAKADAEGQILSARQDMGLSATEVAGIEHLAVEAARRKYEDNVKALEGEGKYTAEEAAQLIALNDERAKLRDALVERRKQQELFREAEARDQNAQTVQVGLLEAQSEVLRSQGQLAKTAKERRTIEQQLLDIAFEEEKMRLQAQISLAERLKAEAARTKSAQDLAAADAAEAAAAVARAKLATLPARQANATAGNNQANAGPLQSYFDSIPQTAAQIDDALQQVATHGLQNFTDSLTNAIVNFQSLGDVGRAVLSGLAADLIKLAIQQVILHTIGRALGTATIAATTAQAAAAGAAWAGPAALASLATLGANAGPAAAALASTTALATLLGAPKAAGGRIFGSGSDTSDNILTPMSPGEFAIKARSARSIGYGTLDYINRNGELPHFAGGGQIRRVQPMNDAAASPGRTLTSADVREFRSIVGDAVRAGLQAMPDVNLYASLDPVDMFQRALGAPAGHRALLAHLSNNSSAVKASLNRP